MAAEQDARTASSLERTSLALEVLTVALIVLISPLSFVLLLPFGVQPERWLSIWQEYVFIFLVLAVAAALVGFAAASSYRVRARTIRRSIRKD